MKIVNVKIEDIKPYENNPRKHDKNVDKIIKSIEDYGFNNPLILDKNNVIITGHGRFMAAKQMGTFKVLPCIIAEHLSEEKANEYRIVDNKTSEMSTWDEEKLYEELKNMELSAFGLEFKELEAKFDKTEVKDDDYDFTTDVKSKVKRGQIWKLGNHRLMCGDSTSPEDVNKLMGGKEADLIFTDPPYNVNYEGSNGMKIQNDHQASEQFYNFLKKAFDNMFSHTRRGGVIYCCHADTEGLNFRTALQESGFKLSECLIWVKNTFVFGRSDYHWRHEPILYGWKEGDSHYMVDDRTQDTVWEFDKPRDNALHPTMKPIDLVGKAIKNSSKINDLVLDLFGGSGSTLIASEQLNRTCYMMELDEHYADVIIDRFEKLTGKKAELIK